MPDSPDTSAASIVRDHAFEPRRGHTTIVMQRAVMHSDGKPYWTTYLGPNEALCVHCRLAEAAHIR
jgi:hypothetical protein